MDPICEKGCLDTEHFSIDSHLMRSIGPPRKSKNLRRASSILKVRGRPGQKQMRPRSQSVSFKNTVKVRSIANVKISEAERKNQHQMRMMAIQRERKRMHKKAL